MCVGTHLWEPSKKLALLECSEMQENAKKFSDMYNLKY